VRWHRAGFRCCWRWKSRARGGRPQIDTEQRALVWRMSMENPLWGAPRIHCELFKLGFEVAPSSVAKYMVRRRGSPGQGWRTFLHSHAPDTAAMADRIDPARVFGPHHCLGRGTSALDSNFLCRLLQFRQNASVIVQGCADFSSDSTDRKHSFTPDPRRASPSLRPGLSFRYTQLPYCRRSKAGSAKDWSSPAIDRPV
jgi:hypothetical protein